VIESLIEIDSDLFLRIHQGTANAFFDWLMPILRNKMNWIPLYVFFATVAIYKYKWKGLAFIIAAALTVTLADQFSAGFIKPIFERLRPCNDEFFRGQIRQLVHCGGGYSFISAHATNHFALALFFTWFFNRLYHKTWIKYVFVFWAFSIAYAQVYVGVHYPFDVLVGALCGMIIGWMIITIMRKVVLPRLKLN
jgi:undecaprenyl-diphosphatase